MAIDIEGVKLIIARNIRHIHTVDDVAKRMNVSQETMRKTFYRASQINLSEFISKIRVERMKQQLLETDESCKVICMDAGSRDDAGGRLLKKLTGMTMGEFRKRYGNDPAVRDSTMKQKS